MAQTCEGVLLPAYFLVRASQVAALAAGWLMAPQAKGCLVVAEALGSGLGVRADFGR